MKALVYSDLQATDGHERCFHNPALSLQQYRVQQFYSLLFQVYEEEKCDCLWDLGDTTDDRSYIPMPTIDTVIAGLEPFPHHPCNLKLIGNHEQFLRDTTVHIGRLFSSKFKVVANFDELSCGDTMLFAAAFPSTDNQTVDWLRSAAYRHRNAERRILLGHFQVVGSQMNSGKAITGIPTKSLDPFTLSLLGHIHKPQKIGRSAHYVGSPFQQNFGEKNETKRVGIVDVHTAEVTWIELDGFPEYRVCSYADFARLVKEEEEHRYQVYLRAPEESQAFYAHPLMSRAEPIYDYKLSNQEVETAETAKAWTMEDVMLRYTKKVPPSTKGISTSETEMVEYGKAIAIEV